MRRVAAHLGIYVSPEQAGAPAPSGCTITTARLDMSIGIATTCSPYGANALQGCLI